MNRDEAQSMRERRLSPREDRSLDNFMTLTMVCRRERLKRENATRVPFRAFGMQSRVLSSA